MRSSLGLAGTVHDFRAAARGVWRHRGFAASAIVVLAIGIAASTGLFAVVDAVVLHPFPFAGAERIARVQLLPSSGQPRPAAVTADEFLALRRAATLDAVFVRDSFTKTLGGSSYPESVWTEYYTGNALTLLGITPVIGRAFTEAEAPVGAAPQRVALLTHRFWRRHFASQPAALGQVLRLDGEPFAVIGVLPEDYAMDVTDIVLPLPMPRDATSTWPVTVRVRPGVSMATAEGELQQFYAQFADARPDAFPRVFQVQLRRLVDDERGATYVPILGLLFTAAALLLLIGCANVTILLLARGRHRVHEIAVRHALGAGRSRLVRLLLCEALLVTALAAALAIALAHYALPLLLTGVPGVVAQRADRIVIGPAAILFATSLAALAAFVSGIWPAIAVSRARSDAMRQASAVRPVATTGRAGSSVLVAAQVAVAVVLLAGTGAAMRALVDLYRAPAGYDPARVVAGQIYLPVGSYTTWAQRVALYERLRAEVTREASVESATISLIPTGPPPRTGVPTRIDADGLGAGDREVLAHAVASDYFSTLKMPLARGRMWAHADDERAEPVAVINETMARQLWPNENPIGKRVRDRAFVERRSQWVLNAPGRDGWFEIVGVVRDAPNRGVGEPIAPAMYYPYSAAVSDTIVLLVRTRGNPIAAERDLRVAVGRADGNLPIIRFITTATFMRWQEGQFVTAVLSGFAAAALLLAAFGLFSVASYSIATRTHEFGVRIALGAAPGAVRRTALQSVGTAVLAGLVVGLALSLALDTAVARWSIRNLADPLVLAGVVVTLIVSALAAAAIPARRATSIDPAIALRSE